MILILTNKLDFAVDYTILRLETRGIAFCRLNAEDLASLEYTAQIRAQVSRRQIKCGSLTIDADSLTGVWFRRQMLPPKQQDSAASFGPFARRELAALVDGLLADPKTTWVNPLQATIAAERKIFQLREAARVGFAVPDTVASNDLEAVRSLLLTGGPLVIKPISHGLVVGEKGALAAYTRRLNVGELDGIEGRLDCPVLVQREILRGRDLRVTVVGRQCFGASVEWDSIQEVDWRAPGSRPAFREWRVPRSLERLCFRLMRSLSLLYAAFDFIEDANGQIWFLELNPAGEFAWLERELGFSVRDLLIDMLIGVPNGD